MKRHSALASVISVLAMCNTAHAGDTWIVSQDPTVFSLLETTLRSAVAASKTDTMQPALNRIKLRQSVDRHPKKDGLGRILIEVLETVSRLPIEDSATLLELRRVGIDPHIKDVVDLLSDEDLGKTSKLSWKLSVVELLVEAKPKGYARVCETFLVASAADPNQDDGIRGRAFVAIARGFGTGEMSEESVRRCESGVAEESYDFKRLRLGVLGQVGNRDTLRLLTELRPAESFAEVRDNVDVAIAKLSYSLAPDPRAKEETLRAILADDAPPSLLLIDWALKQAVRGDHVSLQGLLEQQSRNFADTSNFLANEFDKAATALRTSKQSQP